MKQGCYIIFSLVMSTSLCSQSVNKKVPERFPTMLELMHPELLNKFKFNTQNPKNNPRHLKVFSPSLTHTAFFCKIEDKLTKHSKIPVKMRLGDVDYVDRIEGKGVQTHNPN